MDTQSYQATPEQLDALCRVYDWWARMQPIIEQRKLDRKAKEKLFATRIHTNWNN